MPHGWDSTAWWRSGAPQPAVTRALQRAVFRTVTSALEKSVTYSRPLAGSRTASSGELPVAIVGNRAWQPPVWVPSQVAMLSTETEPGASPLALLTTYRVCVASSATMPNGPPPTFAVAARCPHPDMSPARHVAPLSTDTVSPSKPLPVLAP